MSRTPGGDSAAYGVLCILTTVNLADGEQDLQFEAHEIMFAVSASLWEPTLNGPSCAKASNKAHLCVMTIRDTSQLWFVQKASCPPTRATRSRYAVHVRYGGGRDSLVYDTFWFVRSFTTVLPYSAAERTADMFGSARSAISASGLQFSASGPRGAPDHGFGGNYLNNV